MAHQSTTVPIRNTRSEPISWPTPEEDMARLLPARASTTTDDIYGSALSAVERSLRLAQRKISSAANSLAHSVRRFADERPLHLVGIVAGVALLTGVGLRMWRSHEDA